MQFPPGRHITLISTQANWHGGEKQAALLAEGLEQRGHRCSIICREDGEFAKRMDEHFEVHRISKRVRSMSALYQIRQALQKLQPDVVHANDAHALTAFGLATLGKSFPIRVAARRVDFRLRSARKYRWFSDGLICVSNAVANVCSSSGVPPEHLHIVHDGVSPEFAESGDRESGRSSLALSNEHCLLLTVAKLTDHKGHRYFLEALPELTKQHPQIVVALAGDGELRDSLETLATELGVRSSVRFLGYRQDVQDLLAAADVIVQPSHMEGLCSSLIDAMLAARPIVASRAGGIPDLLQVHPGEQEVGWLVEPRDPSSLAQAIGEAITNRTLATQRANAARERALRQFTADQMVERTLQAYALIAQQKYGDQAAFEARLTSSASSEQRSAA